MILLTHFEYSFINHKAYCVLYAHVLGLYNLSSAGQMLLLLFSDHTSHFVAEMHL